MLWDLNPIYFNETNCPRRYNVILEFLETPKTFIETVIRGRALLGWLKMSTTHAYHCAIGGKCHCVATRDTSDWLSHALTQ